MSTLRKNQPLLLAEDNRVVLVYLGKRTARVISNDGCEFESCAIGTVWERITLDHTGQIDGFVPVKAAN